MKFYNQKNTTYIYKIKHVDANEYIPKICEKIWGSDKCVFSKDFFKFNIL